MQTFNLSFEFFPPKTDEGHHNFTNAAKQLSALEPEYFSVTFGAGGSTRDGTINSIKALQKLSSTAAAPHISCIGSTRDELIALLEEYKKLNVTRVVALRGDLPSGMGQAGELRYASDLVELIRDTTGSHFHIEVAAYPEFHPHAQSAMNDVLSLKKKLDAGANSAITQYFYNPDAYFYFIDYCAKLGIFAPIVPGIMPITQFSRLIRFSEVCGAEIPRWIRKRLETYGDDTQSVKQFGFEVVHDLCSRLISGGAPGLHFYTLNHAEPSAALVKMLGVTNKDVIITSKQNSS